MERLRSFAFRNLLFVLCQILILVPFRHEHVPWIWFVVAGLFLYVLYFAIFLVVEALNGRGKRPDG